MRWTDDLDATGNEGSGPDGRDALDLDHLALVPVNLGYGPMGEYCRLLDPCGLDALSHLTGADRRKRCLRRWFTPLP